MKPLPGDPLSGLSQIKMDAKKNGMAYTVSAEIPGVRKENNHVTVKGGTVAVRAEVKQEDSHKDDRALRSERYFGSVSRGCAVSAVAPVSATAPAW